MRQALRFYIRHDYDLIALRVKGISLKKLGKTALEAYANGKRVHVCIDQFENISDDNVMNFLKTGERQKPLKNQAITTFKCEFITKDPEAIRLLKAIKPKRRNQFIKILIRNTLTEQNLSSFFADKTYVEKENQYLSSINKDYIPNLIPTPMHNKKTVDLDTILVAPKPVRTEKNSEEKNVKKMDLSEEVLKEAKVINEDISSNPGTAYIDEDDMDIIEQSIEEIEPVVETVNADSDADINNMFASMMQNF